MFAGRVDDLGGSACDDALLMNALLDEEGAIMVLLEADCGGDAIEVSPKNEVLAVVDVCNIFGEVVDSV